ncbi:GntR family transcriptional regulator [Marivita sp. S6314]|uniref:GntR family transcriptional regulator n=1 Tax=Marivita sp. S6314 TaxID=2926406 RepID=UPI001FF5B207|nr:GntR family transcriptional regulator [Marivita sp. S6314]
MLKETELAEEFGVSRTPIRQILQLLAHAQLVETHIGVGTSSVVMNEADKVSHFRVYMDITRIAAHIAGDTPAPRHTTLELMAVQNMLKVDDDRSADAFVALYGRVIDAMALTVMDPILCFAIQAAHWRALRWRAQDIQTGGTEIWKSVEANLQNAVDGALSGKSRILLLAASHNGQRYIQEMAQHTTAPTPSPGD